MVRIILERVISSPAEVKLPARAEGAPLVPSKNEIVVVPTPKARERLGSGKTPRPLSAPTVPAIEEQDPGEQQQPPQKATTAYYLRRVELRASTGFGRVAQ